MQTGTEKTFRYQHSYKLGRTHDGKQITARMFDAKIVEIVDDIERANNDVAYTAHTMRTSRLKYDTWGHDNEGQTIAGQVAAVMAFRDLLANDKVQKFSVADVIKPAVLTVDCPF